jgi:hypothetical protein
MIHLGLLLFHKKGLRIFILVPVLEKDEKIIYSVKPKIIPMFFNFETFIFIGFMGIFSTFGSYFTISVWEFFLVGLVALIILLPALRNLLKLLSMSYIITNRRLLVDSKVSGKDKKDILLSDIKSVSVSQNFVGIFFHSGTVIINTSIKKGVLKMVNVPNCNQMKLKIQKACGNQQ